MALQLLSLVTVNWLLSLAVRVFYGRPFVQGLCLGFTPVRRSYRRPGRRTGLQPEDCWRGPFSPTAPPLPPPLLLLYLSIHLRAPRGNGDKSDRPAVKRWSGSPALFIYKGRL